MPRQHDKGLPRLTAIGRQIARISLCSLLAATAATGLDAAAQAPQSQAQSPVRNDADARARALVGKLTLQEKIDQLLNVAPSIPRLGIPAYNWWTESLHGALGPLPTTNFP